MNRRGFLFSAGAAVVVPAAIAPAGGPGLVVSFDDDPSTSVGTSCCDLRLYNVLDAVRLGGEGGDLVLHPVQLLDLVDDLHNTLQHAEKPEHAEEMIAALFACDLGTPPGPLPVHRATILGIRVWTTTAVPLVNGGADRSGRYLGSREIIAVYSDA